MIQMTPHAKGDTSSFDRIARRALFTRLRKIQRGSVVLSDGDADYAFGQPEADLRAQVTVHHPRFYRRMVLGGGLGAAEALMDGDWSCDDLTALVDALNRALSRVK